MEAELAVAAIQSLAILSAVWLSSRHRLLNSGLPYLVSVAVGVLLATALLHILPDAVAGIGNRQSLWLLFTATVLVLFGIERIFAVITGHAVEVSTADETDRGQHHHHRTPRPLGLVIGGMLHSFVDGVSVAAAFSAGRRVGWLTALAITLHEVPHRMGDYALLKHLHVARRKALQLIMLIAAGAVAGVSLVVFAGNESLAAKWLLPVSAASFVYIAMVNLMPELAGERRLRPVLLQVSAMFLGGGLAALLLMLPGS